MTALSNTTTGDCWKRIGVQGDGSCPELERYVHCRNCPVYSAAGQRMLDRPLPHGYRREWTQHYAQHHAQTAAATTPTFIFRIATEWLALPPTLFLEVLELRPVHSLPHRRGTVVQGLVNVRGELQVCLSLAALLGIVAAGGSAPALHRRLLVASHQAGRFVFPVDEAHGLHRFDPRELKPLPTTVAHALSRHSRGVLSWQGKSVGVLDETTLLAACERSLS